MFFRRKKQVQQSVPKFLTDSTEYIKKVSQLISGLIYLHKVDSPKFLKELKDISEKINIIRLTIAKHAQTYDQKFFEDNAKQAKNNAHTPFLDILAYIIAILRSLATEENPQIVKSYLIFMNEVLKDFQILKNFDNYQVPKEALKRLKPKAIYEIHNIKTIYQIELTIRKKVDLFYASMTQYIKNLDKQLKLFNDICYESFTTHCNNVYKLKFISYRFIKLLFLFRQIYPTFNQYLEKNINEYFFKTTDKNINNLFSIFSQHKFPKDLSKIILKDFQQPTDAFAKLSTKFQFTKEENKNLTREKQKIFTKILNTIRYELVTSFQHNPFHHIRVYKTYLRPKEESHIPSTTFMNSFIHMLLKEKIITFNRQHLENLCNGTLSSQDPLFYRKVEVILLDYLKVLRSYYNAIARINKEYNAISQSFSLSIEQINITNYLSKKINDELKINFTQNQINFYREKTILRFDTLFLYQLPKTKNLIKTTTQQHLSLLHPDNFQKHIETTTERITLVLNEIKSTLDYYKNEYEEYYRKNYLNEKLTLESIETNLVEFKKMYTLYTTKQILPLQSKNINQRYAA